MESSQNFGHEHPLQLLLNEEQMKMMSNEISGKLVECWRCGEKILSAPIFSCTVEYCGFYLHKECAEAPLEINHPFHSDHPLILQEIPSNYIVCVCDFCDKTCKRLVYHCSCGLDFDIKCALFTYNIAQKNFKELQHVAYENPLLSIENNVEKLEDLTTKYCFACWEPLAKYAYFSRDCGFNLHKKCADLPLIINGKNRKHPLALQFNSKSLPCEICGELILKAGLVYCCPPCNSVVNIQCAPPPFVEVESHQHAFTLFRRRAPFICDACGTHGHYAGYICSSCHVIVHEKCISLPGVIKSKSHDHCILHTYFFGEEDFKSWDCLICHNEVNVSHGSYSCSVCEFIFHVNCVTADKDSYFIVSDNKDEKSSDSLALLEDPIKVIESDAGEATRVDHFLHMHDLILLRDNVTEEENDKCCDGCRLPISDSFYHCSSCDFFLHKACAKLPKRKHVWNHNCRKPLILTSYNYFTCFQCGYLSNGFGYICNECDRVICIRCVIALSLGALPCPGHQHPLFLYKDYIGECSACGKNVSKPLHCKDCNFSVCHTCFSLPTTARHKCDKHILQLTYRDDNDYPESHYCDICEEQRDPNRWFYHCATCDTSAHINCVLGRYPYIKLGKYVMYENAGLHPHPLVFVKKTYYYPECDKCTKPCEDLALECAYCCNYIVHWKCRK